MKVVKPVTIGPAQLISSSVPETDKPLWSSGTAYALHDEVMYDHALYKCIQGPATGKNPATEPLYWARTGPTNRWAMFDSEVSTQTSAEGALTVVLKPGYANGLALFGLLGSSVTVTVRDGAEGPVVFEHQQSLDGSIITDWYQYFFEPIDQLEEAVITGMPPYTNAHVTVSITGTEVKCGILVIGNVYEIGRMQRGATAGIIDYSRKDTDVNGKTTFVKRKYSKRMSAPLVVENIALNKLQRTLAGLRATPCVWIGTDSPGYQPLTIFGFYRDFSISIEYMRHSLCNLEIEGLT